MRVARALASLPRLAEALARGELSYSKVRALTRVASPETEELIRGRLEPGAGAVLMQALTAARATVYQEGRRTDATSNVPAGTSSAGVADEPPTWGQLQADALALIAETALHHGMDPGAAGERCQVVVHVDAAVLADADAPGQAVLDGARVSAETSQRLACDASRVVMRHSADGNVSEVGARTRTIPPALRRALQHRDQGCRFPGCGSRFGQGHHIRHWAHGGPTTLANLTMLNGELRFRTPHGRPLPTVPGPPAAPAAPVESLREKNEALGLHIDAHISTPSWLGERLDLEYAISVMHPLACRPSVMAR